MRELYINGKLVDLEPSEPIACTYQRNDIGDLKDRQADYTNEFNLPLTKTNKIILGNPELVQSQSAKPYRKNTARLLQDGIEIIGNGVAIIGSSTLGEGFVSVTVYSGIFDLFARLGDKTLKDVDFEDLSHIWNNTFAVSAKDNLTGVVYPLIKTEVSDISDSTWAINNQVPSVFVRTIFERIINQAGYTISGDFFLTSQYQNMIMPMLDTFERDEKWIKDRSSYVTFSQQDLHLKPEDNPNSRDVTWGSNYATGIDGDNTGFTETYVPFDVDYPIDANTNKPSEFFDGAKDNYNSGGWQYRAKEAMIINIRVDARIYLSAPLSGSCVYVMTVKKNGVDIFNVVESTAYQGTTAFDPQCEKLIAGETSIQVNANDYIEVFHRFEKNSGVGAGEIFVYRNGTSIRIVPSKIIPVNSILDIRSVISPMKQKDFLKSILQMFGISIQNDNYADVLRFATFNEIAEKAPLDWSNKLDLSQEIEVRYRFDNYAQSNKFKYGKNVKETEVGNGEFLIEDDTLEVETNVVELPFAGTEEGSLFPQLFKVADLPITNISFERLKTEPRLLMIDRNATWSGLVIVDGINASIPVDSNYPYAYFTKSGGEGLDFNQDLIPKYYKYLIDAFNKCKIVNCFLNLTPVDIQNLDFFNTIYIEYFNAKFYINIVEEYTGQGSTKCELVRL